MWLSILVMITMGYIISNYVETIKDRSIENKRVAVITHPLHGSEWWDSFKEGANSSALIHDATVDFVEAKNETRFKDAVLNALTATPAYESVVVSCVYKDIAEWIKKNNVLGVPVYCVYGVGNPYIRMVASDSMLPIPNESYRAVVAYRWDTPNKLSEEREERVRKQSPNLRVIKLTPGDPQIKQRVLEGINADVSTRLVVSLDSAINPLIMSEIVKTDASRSVRLLAFEHTESLKPYMDGYVLNSLDQRPRDLGFRVISTGLTGKWDPQVITYEGELR